jgi:LysR family cyn operon transcriptional activator
MRLEQLHYVVATVDHGTMTRAAAACGVTQPALTRAIRSLERELGVTVFSRAGRMVELSPDGREVVEIARRVMDDVAALTRLGTDGLPIRTLTIAATPTLHGDLGSGLVRELWREHPTIAVRLLRCESNDAVVEAVADHRADAGIADDPVSVSLVVVPFEEREVVLVAPPGSSLPEPFPVSKLSDIPRVLPAKGSRRRVEIDATFAARGRTSEAAFESDERSSWIPAVLSGVGSCVMYRTQGDEAAALGAEVHTLDPPLHRTITVVHRRGPLNPEVADLLEVARSRAVADGLTAAP